MALYYDLGPLFKKYNDDQELVKERLVAFIEDSHRRLKKMKTGIDEKAYVKVNKHTQALLPSLDFLGMDQALEELSLIEKWTKEEGKTKEVKEIFKSFKTHVKNAVKELKKDFGLQV